MGMQLTSNDNLEELICFLEQPASYPHNPDTVKKIQTHISYVFMAPPYVYKLKKPVDFGFLDFSTLEKRHHFCLEEVRLNQRLCSNTYVGVCAITKKTDGFSFDSGYEAVDYVVKMKLLPAQYFLDEILKNSTISFGQIDLVIDKLASLYQAQQPNPDISSWGQQEKLELSTDENFQQVLPFIDDLVPSSVFLALKHFTDVFYIVQKGMFESRWLHGHIKDCHGDLRLEHIHISPEGVCIYDCIEFNKRFRYIDVANDIGFLAMDLDHKGYPDLSHYLCERAALKLDDPDLLSLIPFYKIYRAFVRGKVAAIKSVEKEIDEQSRIASRKEAWSCFQLALQYAVSGKKPSVVVLMGRVGSGKSTQARLLAEHLGWPLLSSDVTRKQLAGVPIYTRGSNAEREQLYSKEQTEQTYQTLILKTKAFLRQHKSVVLDATFSSKKYRRELYNAITSMKSACHFIEVTASEDTIKLRLEQRDEATNQVSDARLEDYDVLNLKYEMPDAEEDYSVYSISSDGALDVTAFEILKHLVSMNLNAPPV